MTELMTKGRIRLGAEIQRRRKQLGLTQEELAQRMDVSRQSVTKWETGQSAPDLDRLVQLREVLNVSLDELLKGPSSDGTTESRSENGDESPPAADAEYEHGTTTLHTSGFPASLSFFFRVAGGLLLFAGLSAMIALWVFSVIFPVQLTDWDGSLHTGLEGYLMAHDYQPLLHAALGAACLGSFCLLFASASIRRFVRRCLHRMRRRRGEAPVDKGPINTGLS